MLLSNSYTAAPNVLDIYHSPFHRSSLVITGILLFNGDCIVKQPHPCEHGLSVQPLRLPRV